MKGQDCGQLTLFQEDSPASHFLSPGSGEARKMTVTSGLKCSGLSKSSGRLGLLEKMLLGSSIWRSTLCYLTWKPKATPAGRLWFQLVASTPRTGGTGSQLWATPNTMDGLPQRSPDALKRQAETSRKGRSRPANLREQVCLETVRMWPTPTAREYKGGRNPETLLQKGRKPSNTLGDAVIWSTPQARDYRTGQKERYENPKRTKNLNDQVGGQVNPTWVEWLMGFPIGWTDLNA